MITLRLRDYFVGERLQRDTQRYLRRLRELPVLRSRETTSELLRWLRAQPGPHVRLGTTTWDETVAVPLCELVKACGLTTGGMGSGKTMFALLLIRAIIELLPGLRTISFGVLDAKGELFERTLYLLALRLEELQGAERQALLRRLPISACRLPTLSPCSPMTRCALGSYCARVMPAYAHISSGILPWRENRPLPPYEPAWKRCSPRKASDWRSRGRARRIFGSCRTKARSCSSIVPDPRSRGACGSCCRGSCCPTSDKPSSPGRIIRR